MENVLLILAAGSVIFALALGVAFRKKAWGNARFVVFGLSFCVAFSILYAVRFTFERKCVM